MLFFLSTFGFAQEIEQKADVQLGLSYWRLGANVAGWYGARIPMFEQEDNILFQNTGLKLQAGGVLCPAFVRYGGRATFSPLAILDISVFGLRDQYFDVFQNLVDYDSPDADYGLNDDIETYINNDPTRRSAGGGWHAGGSLTLKAKVSSVIVLLNGGLEYWSIDSENAKGEWIWEPQIELLIKANGDMYRNAALVVLNEWVINAEKQALFRAGFLGTYRGAAESQDTLIRAGGIFIFQQNRYIKHNVLLQAYLVDRAMPIPSQYFAYALGFEY